jgi:hypothetical protein
VVNLNRGESCRVYTRHRTGFIPRSGTIQSCLSRNGATIATYLPPLPTVLALVVLHNAISGLFVPEEIGIDFLDRVGAYLRNPDAEVNHELGQLLAVHQDNPLLDSAHVVQGVLGELSHTANIGL